MARRIYAIGLPGAMVLLVLFALAPVAWAAPLADEENSIDADDQPILNGTVTVGEVNAAQDGWVTVHLDEGGKPGKVLGYTAVKKGETYGVGVELSEVVPIGGKLWPMLHIDAGTPGTYEFPGPDTPVFVDGAIVMKQITITAAGRGAASAENTIEADDQPAEDGAITTAKVTSAVDGWLTVHLDEGGAPGKVLGYTAVKKGVNSNVVTKLSEVVPIGGKLWPMLHIDAGTPGTYEFPGPDTPVIANGGIVMKEITVTAAAARPASLPRTGQATAGATLLVFFALAFFGLGVWARRQRSE